MNFAGNALRREQSVQRFLHVQDELPFGNRTVEPNGCGRKLSALIYSLRLISTGQLSVRGFHNLEVAQALDHSLGQSSL
jgi:hypothetical protein